MQQKNFTLYRSSAGSGKTYTLAREYLKLSLKNPEKYRQILAVTFTNKATQEMKDRILHYLYQFSQGKSNPMKAELQSYLSLNDAEFTTRAKLVLNNILHNYSYFSVSTIDSFFQKIIRNFAKEIGLQSGFKIELNQEKVLSEVVEMVLLDIGKNKQLKNWLIRFAQDQVESGGSWDLSGKIKELGREIFKEDFKSIEKNILKISQDQDLLPRYLGKLTQLTQTFEKTLENLGYQACSIMKDFNLSINDFSYSKSGVMGYLEGLCSRKPSPPGSRAQTALNSIEGWYTKTSPKKEVITQAVEGGLKKTLEEVIDLFAREYLKYESAGQLLKFIYTFGILANINQKLQEYRDENSLLLISDATAFLKDIIAENDAPFIYEKTGSVYKHYLIDEFQDTSAFQWSNFRPLISNSIAEGNPNLVVGDIKQSIYRWRGGDWKLLLEQISKDIGEYHTEVLNLNTNWRSKKNIIDFNNSLFNTAPQVLSRLSFKKIEESESIKDENVLNDLKIQAEKISHAYEDVYQNDPSTTINEANFCGYVNMTFIDPKVTNVSSYGDDDGQEELGYKDEVKRRIPKLLEKVQDQGYDLKDVAILVRNKAEGKQLASCILEYKNSVEAKEGYSYEVISSEALFISGASTILLLINVLRYLVNKEDEIAKVHIIHDYQRYIKDNEAIDLNTLFLKAASLNHEDFKELLPDGFYDHYSHYSKLPLYELVEELINLFDLHTIKGEITYIQAFQDMILNFLQEERSDLYSFLEYWTERGSTESIIISDKLDAVKILTIHKSKGLQFKVVLVPFCDWKLDHNTTFTNILWANPQVNPFDDIKYLPIKYTGSLEKTIFQKLYFEEMIRAQMDYLNILYVAFTRAEECLYVFGEKPKLDTKGNYKIKCVSSLLYYVFSEGFIQDKIEIKKKETFTYSNLYSGFKEEQAIFELGDPVFECNKETKTQDVSTSQLEDYISNSWRGRLSIKTKNREFFKSDVKEKINFGILVHQLLSRIQTIEQLPSVLTELYFEGGIDKEDAQLLKEQVEQILEIPQVRDWFTSDYKVMTEAPVLPRHGEIRRFDRVMIKGNKAIVVDFKTGQINKAHNRQLIEYADLLKEMNFDQVEGYLVYLAEGIVEKVV